MVRKKSSCDRQIENLCEGHLYGELGSLTTQRIFYCYLPLLFINCIWFLQWLFCKRALICLFVLFLTPFFSGKSIIFYDLFFFLKSDLFHNCFLYMLLDFLSYSHWFYNFFFFLNRIFLSFCQILWSLFFIVQDLNNQVTISWIIFFWLNKYIVYFTNWVMQQYINCLVFIIWPVYFFNIFIFL